MTEKLISLQEFFKLRKSLPILDARSEGEFAQSHIPEAINLPILTNQERVLVGTLYKEKGNQEAILKGFELVGPRFHSIQKEALQLFPEKKILLYCWRGGMRSQILSWLLTMVGFEVFRLQGGYKTYRTFTFEEVRKTRRMIILGGKTGSAKTLLLHELEKTGEQIIDLEGLANHKGSSFGAIGQAPQPSVEQFENLLAEKLLQTNPEIPIWVENESRKIGRTILPDRFFEQMQTSCLIDIHKSEEDRIAHIAEEYGDLPKDELIAAIKRLGKRLGGLRTQQAIKDVEEGNNESWIANLLMYYDKTYDFDLQNHHKNTIYRLDLEGKSLSEHVSLLIQAKQQCHD
ncbi:MAG: tRNA 2-selenouridine(34) synthase MnmH [Bacteroidota bacterium]